MKAVIPMILFFALIVSAIAQEEDASNTTTNTTVSSNSTDTDPYSQLLKHLFINIRKPALSSSITATVYSENALFPPFNSCTLESTTSPDFTGTTNTDCFSDDPFNGRLSFQLTFQADPAVVKAAIISRPPEVFTTTFGQTIASPSVISVPSSGDDSQDDTDDEVSNSMIVTVVYNCKSNSNGVVPVRLTLHFGTETENDVVIIWRKNCDNGINGLINYGYLTGDEDQGSEQLHKFGQDAAALITVGASDESTEFFLKLEKPGALQTFLAPLVTSTFSDIVSINVRGNHPQGGLLEGLTITKFQIGYECHRKGEATIETTIGIPPFRNISATWKKDCGGSAASNLQVGSTEEGFDIVDNGEPTPRYMVGIESIGAEHSEEHMHIAGNESHWEFFVKNEANSATGKATQPESDTAMLVGRITATVEKPSVLYPLSPIVMTRTAMKWREDSKSGSAASYTLQEGESLKVVMPLLCRVVGKESRVLITVPILGYKELEFGIAKMCTQVGKVQKSSQFVLTVRTVFWGAVFVAAGVGVLWYVKSKRAAKGASFSPVPLYEQR